MTATTEAKVKAAREYAEHHGIKPWTEHIFNVLDALEDAEAFARVNAMNYSDYAAAIEDAKEARAQLAAVQQPNRDELIELLNSSQHAPMETHDGRSGECLQCPWPLHELGPEEIADAILAALPIPATGEAETLYLDRFTIDHAYFSGIEGKVTSAVLARKTWNGLGTPDSIRVTVAEVTL